MVSYTAGSNDADRKTERNSQKQGKLDELPVDLARFRVENSNKTLGKSSNGPPSSTLEVMQLCEGCSTVADCHLAPAMVKTPQVLLLSREFF